MKALRIWGWLLFATAVALFSYGWISGEFSGHGIARMDNIDLLLTICSIFCILLAITVLFVAQAIKQSKSAK